MLHHKLRGFPFRSGVLCRVASLPGHPGGHEAAAGGSNRIEYPVGEEQTDYPLLLDYGYALSVHKAQGSEWERVLLIDERNRYMSDDDYTRWLYTGVTRTKERLLIVS